MVFKKHLTNCFLYSFSLAAQLTSKLFTVSANWRKKKAEYGSNYRRCSVRKSVLRNFAKFTGKKLRESLFFDKIAGLGLQLY